MVGFALTSKDMNKNKYLLFFPMQMPFSFWLPCVPNPVWQTVMVMAPSESCYPVSMPLVCDLPLLPSIDRFCFSSLLKPGCPCGLPWPVVWIGVMCEFRNSEGLTASTLVLQCCAHHAMRKPSGPPGDERPHGGEQGPQPTASTNFQTQEQDHL